ncbi:ABC transporter substrate-binding protein [Paenarthrobacter sp. RAF54_2]|uniref:ABC transporter substrate-binding protein n=1 Tax=Paenarthrobacter sp. RAF54_2 TaxID=3233061 RepID=UPI003F9CF5D0
MKKMVLSTSLAALALFAVSACGADPAPTATQAGGPTSITVGVSPSTASAAVYLAAEQEFKEQGLDVKTATIQSGAEAIPRLLNGELAFALGDAAGTMTAAANGVGIVASGVATTSPSDPGKDYSGIVADDPAITNVKALEGKTVAVNQLKGISELTARAAIDNQGGNSAAVQFVELPFPQMTEAVATGKVSAALLVEPFLSGAKAKGLHVVIAPQAYAVADLPSTIFVSSSQFASTNPEVVKKFQAAMSKASTRANADAADTRRITATYTKIAPEVLNVITLPIYAEDAADTSGMRTLAGLMNKYKLLDNQPDLNTLLLGGK